jgi:hypothetical protein
MTGINGLQRVQHRLGFSLLILLAIMIAASGCSGGGGDGDGWFGGGDCDEFEALFVDDFDGASLDTCAWNSQTQGVGAQAPILDADGGLALEIVDAAEADTAVEVILRGFGRYSVAEATIEIISASTPTDGEEAHAGLGIEILDDAGAGEAVIDLMYVENAVDWMQIVWTIRPASGDIDIYSGFIAVNEWDMSYALRIEVDAVNWEVRFYADDVLLDTYRTTGLALTPDSAIFLEAETSEPGADIMALVTTFSAWIAG